ncbi:MAG: hypothetical protein U0840_12490 [Gemmataceae bacterium]
MSLVEVVGQLLVRPPGPFEALLGRPLDHPAFDLVGQRGGDLGGRSLGLAGHQAGQAALAVGVEPALDGAAVDAQVGGEVLAPAALVGHQDDLKAVAVRPVVGGPERLLQMHGLHFSQPHVDHGCFLPLEATFPPPIVGTGHPHRERV